MSVAALEMGLGLAAKNLGWASVKSAVIDLEEKNHQLP